MLPPADPAPPPESTPAASNDVEAPPASVFGAKLVRLASGLTTTAREHLIKVGSAGTTVPQEVDVLPGSQPAVVALKDEDDASAVLVVPVNRDVSRRHAAGLMHKQQSNKCCAAPDPTSRAYNFYLSFLALGIIYGDIGTSPLYTFTSVFNGVPPSENDVIGGLSLMLWSLIVVAGIKYLGFVLEANDYGEGGTLALFSVVMRSLRGRITDKPTLSRLNTFFSVMALIGVACLLADGILTPAISVLGAVQGLTIASPSLGSDAVIGVSCAIIVLLFLPQRFGTKRVSSFFSPIMVLWFLSLFMIGVYNLTLAPQVLKAFSPSYGFEFLIANGYHGFATMGAVFLTITGSEAMYADLGHFNTFAVRFAAFSFVLPCLMICYCGQAAVLVMNKDTIANTFYMTIPSPLFYPMLVLAFLASIIASQAMISATFSLAGQAMRLQLMPQLTLIHTNADEVGQVYVSEINYFYMVLIIIVIAGYQNATALGYAYGIAVSSVMVITTLFYSVAIVTYFRRHWFWAVLFAMWFGMIDVMFLASNLLKFTTGGWFTVTIAAVFSIILILWRWGRLRMVSAQSGMTRPDQQVFAATNHKGEPVPVTSTLPNALVLCYSSNMDTIPAAYVHFFQRFPVRPKNLVFVTATAVNVAQVDSVVTFKPFVGEGFEGVWHASVNYGYMQPVPSGNTLAVVAIRAIGTCVDPDKINVHTVSDEELLNIVSPTFLVGYDRVVLKDPDTASLWHKILVDGFSSLLMFSRSRVATLRVPQDRTVAIGVAVPI